MVYESHSFTLVAKEHDTGNHWNRAWVDFLVWHLGTSVVSSSYCIQSTVTTVLPKLCNGSIDQPCVYTPARSFKLLVCKV